MSCAVHERPVSIMDISMFNNCSVKLHMLALQGHSSLFGFEDRRLIHVIPEGVDLGCTFEVVVLIETLPEGLRVFIHIIDPGRVAGPADSVEAL